MDTLITAAVVGICVVLCLKIANKALKVLVCLIALAVIVTYVIPFLSNAGVITWVQ